MQFHHPGVAVPQVLGHNDQRGAVHHCVASPGVPRDMEGSWRRYLGACRGFIDRPHLVRLEPSRAVCLREYQVAGAAARTGLPEEPGALVVQMTMIDLLAAIALAGTQAQRPDVGIEIASNELCE